MDRVWEQVYEFMEMAKYDPLYAAKAKPEVAFGLVGSVLLVFVMSATVLGAMGSAKPVPKAKVSFYCLCTPP